MNFLYSDFGCKKISSGTNHFVKNTNNNRERIPKMSKGSRRLMGYDTQKKNKSTGNLIESSFNTKKTVATNELLNSSSLCPTNKLSDDDDDDDNEYIIVYDSSKPELPRLSKTNKDLVAEESGIECDKISSSTSSSASQTSNEFKKSASSSASSESSSNNQITHSNSKKTTINQR